jgi:hypothetical protein
MTGTIDPRQVGEAIDHLVTAPIAERSLRQGTPIAALHAEARRHAGMPLALAAARLALERIGSGDRVLLISGFLIGDQGQRAETDGPGGAAVLGRALKLALGAAPVGVSDAAALPAMRAAFRAAGLAAAALVDFPVAPDGAEPAAARLLDRLEPRLVVAIERPGAAEDGAYHNAEGAEISSFTAKTDRLFAMARARGIATIGIGDLGNELGLGALAAAVARLVPRGERIAAALAADRTVIATISNWGAYGVAACLAALTGRPDAFHDGAQELRLLEAVAAAGAIDPLSGEGRPHVDGTTPAANAALVELLRAVVLRACGLRD